MTTGGQIKSSMADLQNKAKVEVGTKKKEARTLPHPSLSQAFKEQLYSKSMVRISSFVGCPQIIIPGCLIIYTQHHNFHTNISPEKILQQVKLMSLKVELWFIFAL